MTLLTVKYYLGGDDSPIEFIHPDEMRFGGPDSMDDPIDILDQE